MSSVPLFRKSPSGTDREGLCPAKLCHPIPDVACDRRFTGIEHATGHSRSFFPWYNTEHRHGGIAMLTPHDVHYGRAPEVLAQRQRVMDAACAAHPERFVRGIPKIHPLPEAVWINPPATSTKGEIAP